MEPAVGATLAVLAAGGRRPVGRVDRQRRRAGRACGCCAACVPTASSPPWTATRSSCAPRRKAFAEAGIAAGRARLIFGTPAEVLPRLSPGAYDLVVCAGPPREYSRAAAPRCSTWSGSAASLVCHGLLAGRPDRRPHGPRPADGRLARGRPHDPRGRDAAVRRPPHRHRPAGRHQAVRPPATPTHSQARGGTLPRASDDRAGALAEHGHAAGADVVPLLVRAGSTPIRAHGGTTTFLSRIARRT